MQREDNNIVLWPLGLLFALLALGHLLQALGVV